MSLLMFKKWVRGEATAYLVTYEGDIIPVAFADVAGSTVSIGTLALSQRDAENRAAAARARRAAAS